ncbi:MAG: acyl-CoA dehydrogenase family protein [Promethearchaeota archaeon]
MSEETPKIPNQKKMHSQIIPDDVLEALSLKRRYDFINANMMALLKDNEKSFFNKIQRFCMKYERKTMAPNGITHDDDFYPWIKDFGAKGYVTRGENFTEIGIDYKEKWGLTYEFFRCMAVDFFDPSFNMSMGATVLAITPLLHHHDGREAPLQAMKELVTGEEVGCICITEPTKGSDAVHLDTVAKRSEDGIRISGVKCFNTNAPKSKWAVVYGTEDPSSPTSDKMMSQSLVEFPDDSVKLERAYIPWVPRIQIGKETFNNTFVPNDRILCDVGKGKYGLFEGLVPERMGIAILDIAESWGALTHAAIYSNVRVQMGKEIIKHQGVGFLLADYYARISNMTLSVLAFCRNYDELVKQYEGHMPGALNQALVVQASQLKYHCAILSERACYDLANLMGGAGVGDNTLMQDLLGISRIQEVVGGSRQIQQYIMSGALRKLWKMS